VLTTPRVMALNKTDAVSEAVVRRIRGRVSPYVPAVAVSAIAGTGIDELVGHIESRV